MSRFTIERRATQRTGRVIAGYTAEIERPPGRVAVRFETWAVLDRGELVAECRSKMKAARVAMCLELVEDK